MTLEYKPGDFMLRCSRSNGGAEGSSMIVEIREPISGAALSFEMPLDQFTMALTSAEGRGTLRHHHALDKLGLRCEYQHVKVPVPYGMYEPGAREVFRHRMTVEHKPDGFEYSHSSFTRDGLSISYARWVAP